MTDRRTDANAGDTSPTHTAPSVSVHVDIAVDPDRVWDALVTDGGLGEWMGDGATLEPRPGGSLTFPDPVGGQQRDGRVTEVIDRERLSYTWWAIDQPTLRSQVEITLDQTSAGTRVTVVETLAPRPTIGFAVPVATAATADAQMVLSSPTIAGGGARQGAPMVTGRSSSLIGMWSWRLAMVTLASQMVRV